MNIIAVHKTIRWNKGDGFRTIRRGIVNIKFRKNLAVFRYTLFIIINMVWCSITQYAHQMGIQIVRFFSPYQNNT